MGSTYNNKEFFYTNLFKKNMEIMFLVNPETSEILDCNEAACAYYEYSYDQMLEKRMMDFDAIGMEKFERENHLVKEGEKNHYCGKHKTASGAIKEVELHSTIIVVAGEKLLSIIVMDISEMEGSRMKLELALAKEKKLMEITLLSVGDGVISCDKEGKILFLNKVAEYLTGWKLEEARGLNIEAVFHIVDEFTGEKSENIVGKVIESKNTHELAANTILISKNGIERPIEDSAAPIMEENGDLEGVVLVFRDFSARKQKLNQIEYLSYHDQLTELYNRRFYEEEVRRLDTERNLPLSIIMGDVNGLKLVNDSFGHAMGDELLKKAAQIIRMGCRDDEIIARFGGDEFIVLLPKTDEEEAGRIINRIKELCRKEKLGAVDVSISFGKYTKTREEEDINEVFKKAEDHMYQEKLFESPHMREKTIDAILNVLHIKNKEEDVHSLRVSKMSEMMGQAIGLNEQKIESLKNLGLLHDIGEIAIEEGILSKEGQLTELEREEVKRHSEIGYRILSTVKNMSEMAEYVLYHHERWNGEGYPKGLKAEEIPIESRIIAIVDAYDAMTSKRSYRDPMTEKKVLEELEKNAGSQFDPDLVFIFIKKVMEKK